MSLELASKLIESPGLNSVNQLFRAGAKQKVMWVDGRAGCEELVRAVALLLPGERLAAEEGADGRLWIRFRDKLLPVPRQPGTGDHDLTLRALAGAIRPDFDVRFVKASTGTDALAFMLLDRAAWSGLEKKYCRRVEDAFERVTICTSFFARAEAAADLAAVQEVRLLPVLRKRTAIKGGAGDQAVLAEDFCDELVVTYAAFTDTGERTVTVGMLQELGCTETQLVERAMAQARRRVAGLKTTIDGNVLKISARGAMASSLAVFPDIWNDLQADMGSPLLAAFPHVDVALFAPAIDAGAAAALRSAVSAFDRRASGALSSDVYRWTGERWAATAAA